MHKAAETRLQCEPLPNPATGPGILRGQRWMLRRKSPGWMILLWWPSDWTPASMMKSFVCWMCSKIVQKSKVQHDEKISELNSTNFCWFTGPHAVRTSYSLPKFFVGRCWPIVKSKISNDFLFWLRQEPKEREFWISVLHLIDFLRVHMIGGGAFKGRLEWGF